MGFGLVQVASVLLLIVFTMFRDNVPFALIRLVMLPLMLTLPNGFLIRRVERSVKRGRKQ